MIEQLARQLADLRGRVARLETLEVPRYDFYPLIAPYTNTSFDGDSFSTVAANTLIDNAGWSTTIPADAVALNIKIAAKDSGSAAAANCWFGLYPASAAATTAAILYLGGLADDQTFSHTSVVPCTNGDIWYRCTASDVNTLDVWLWCFGYWR
jgi:hypothetical protein